MNILVEGFATLSPFSLALTFVNQAVDLSSSLFLLRNCRVAIDVRYKIQMYPYVIRMFFITC